MTALISALILGLILSLLGLGVYISFRIFNYPDITVDGSVTFGACIAAVLLVKHVNPWIATFAAFWGGALAGTTTGILHTRFKINNLLSGILVMTGLFSVNLRVLGKSNVPLMTTTTFANYAETLGTKLAGGRDQASLMGWSVPVGDLGMLLLSLIIVAITGLLLYMFFRTGLGTAMRATGDNAQMVRAQGVNDDNMMVAGLAISNGMVAVSGALLAQYQGFTDVQMGIGMVVLGLASVIIGEALVGTRQLGLTITGTVLGSVLFRLLVAIALRAGLDPNDLKLITALFVFISLILPGMLGKMKRKRQVAHA
jgi:putative ABC transport system permease protein